MFDIDSSDHGPFDILVNGEIAARGLVTRNGVESAFTAVCEAKNGRIELLMRPETDADFILNSLVMEALDGGTLLPLFPDQPRDFASDASTLAGEMSVEPMVRLRALADFICTKRRKNGYIGDSWYADENGEGGANVLYASSFPVRALLAAYELTGEARYRNFALDVIDRIVSEQLPNGAFLDYLTGTPTSELDAQTVAERVKNSRKPMSDVGSVISAICVAAHYADAERRDRYIASAKAFADGWAARVQTVNGAFTDGQGLGDTIYSVATAIQASAHSLLYAVTGEEKYLDVAERAIRYLLKDFRPDGSFYGRLCETWETTYTAREFYNYAFGHLFYVEEGLITTSLHTRDAELRSAINAAISARALGEKGFMQLVKPEDVWFPLMDNWDNAKQVGTLQTVTRALRLNPDNERLRKFEADMATLLCTEKPAKRLGIGYEPTVRLKDVCRYCTVGTLSIEASGQAILSLAERIRPGIVYLAQGGCAL